MNTAKTLNNPLKCVPATKNVASTGLANARRLAGRWYDSPRQVEHTNIGLII